MYSVFVFQVLHLFEWKDAVRITYIMSGRSVVADGGGGSLLRLWDEIIYVQTKSEAVVV